VVESTVLKDGNSSEPEVAKLELKRKFIEFIDNKCNLCVGD